MRVMGGNVFSGPILVVGKAEEELQVRLAERGYGLCAHGHQCLQRSQVGRDTVDASESLRMTLNVGSP